LIYK